MQRMTDVLSRMLNDPMTRAALSAGGEDSLDQQSSSQMQQSNEENRSNVESNADSSVSSNSTQNASSNEVAAPLSPSASELAPSPLAPETSSSSMDTTSTEAHELIPIVVPETSESEFSAMETSDEAER